MLLEKIANNSWAKNLFDQYKSRVDPEVVKHNSNPETVLNTIPDFPGEAIEHREALTLGYEAALLYWLTDDNDYGQLAADILSHYTQEVAAISGDLEFTTGKSYSHLIDTREYYTKPPMIYDFVHGFLKDTTNNVYDRESETRSVFDFTIAQDAFIKMADNVFDKGSINSNHPILEAPGALFNLLSIEDDAIRASYMDDFMKGTPKQNGLTWMMDECNRSTVWPEATGYSVGPHRIILELMIVVENYDPSLNVIAQNKDIVKNAFLFENYKFPNLQNVMRFGDAHRNSLNTVAILERVLKISEMKSYGTLKNDAYAMLQALYNDKGGYNPSVSTQSLEWNNPYYLLYGANIETATAAPIDYSRSINIDYAGIAMQRNIETSDVEQYGLMGYTGGAHYVHSHLTGIDMELYGLGAAIGSGGGDVGASNREDDVFRNYHRIFAGHNTVIVNGASKGEGKGSWKGDNQLLQQTTQTISAEPASLAPAISDNFSYSVQELNDEINNAKQQRVLSVIRTSDTSGYYIDIFRSKSLGTNDYHDYVYHNVGDSAILKDSQGGSFALTSQPNRYQSTAIEYGGKTVEFPGWHYFEDVKTSAKTTASVTASIPMTKENTGFMRMLMPGGEEREYTACMGPETIEGVVGYENEKTPIVTVRQYGEAWKKPFVTVFEASKSENGTVHESENLLYGGKIVGTKITSFVESDTIVDYIISNIYANDVAIPAGSGINFDGRFAIVRVKGDTTTLYIGDGNSLSFNGLTLNATARKGIQKFSTIITTATRDTTTATLVKADSVEQSVEYVGAVGKEDTLTTTITMDVYMNASFTIVDSLRGGNWFASDTLFIVEKLTKDTTDITTQTDYWEDPNITSIGTKREKSQLFLSKVDKAIYITGTEVVFNIPEELLGAWKILIYDVKGKLVNRSSFNSQGSRSYHWNLENKEGARISNGQYNLVGVFKNSEGQEQEFSKVLRVSQ